ncbi:MAG: BON domain-containing protein [Candidatus Sulfotelmatobacter sp.]
MNFSGARLFKESARTVVLTGLLIGGGVFVSAQSSNQSAPAADNTKMNQADRNSNQPTADQQKMNPSDRDITQQIRKSIVADKSLSTYAHNVKVITQNGMVTLKGPVRTEEDKKAIEDKAAQVAGADKVTSEIEVQPKH